MSTKKKYIYYITGFFQIYNISPEIQEINHNILHTPEIYNNMNLFLENLGQVIFFEESQKKCEKELIKILEKITSPISIQTSPTLDSKKIPSIDIYIAKCGFFFGVIFICFCIFWDLVESKIIKISFLNR